MQNEGFFRPAAVLNITNAVPKRVIQISTVLESRCPVVQVCWERFKLGNAPEALRIRSHSLLGYFAKLTRILFSNRYSVLLFDDLRLLPLVVAISKFTGSRLIYNRQEVPTVDASVNIARLLRVPKGLIKPVVEALESFFVHGVHAVLTIPVSEREYTRIEKWRKPFAVIWNVPDSSNAKSAKPFFSVRSKGVQTLIYSGAVSKENGLLKYLELVRCLNENGFCSRLLLIGRLWKMTEEELNEIIFAESCGKYVKYREWVPYSELMGILLNADVGLALSDPSFEKHVHMSEGASRKVFTYMAAGLPVVAGGAFGRVVAQEEAGYFVCYNDMGGFVDAVKDILSNPARAWQMGERGRQAILYKYKWKLEQAKIEKILSAVMGMHH